MSELYKTGKIEASNDKESKLYETMLRLGIVEEHEEECEEVSAGGKRLEFPKGYYRTLVYQLSCLLSEKEINTLSGSVSKELFFNNLGLVLAGEKYNIQDNKFSQIGIEFLSEYKECLQSYENNIKFIEKFREFAKEILSNIANKRSVASRK